MLDCFGSLDTNHGLGDANGKIIQKLNVTPSLKYINIGQLATGVYVLTLMGNIGSQTLKFIKK